MQTLKTYYRLTKPGIVRGNLLAATAGFFLASQGRVELALLLWTILGLGLVIASGCVFNNYLDQGIDALMARTKQRALVQKTVTNFQALTYGSALGLAGVAIMFAGTNALAAVIAIGGWFFYVVVYGFAKRKNIHGTLVGSISGSVPLVVGYVSVTSRFDAAALILFLAMAAWQMPHFYAIAIFRAKDYAAARIPVLPVVKGNRVAKLQILAYASAFTLIAPLLTVFGYTSAVYAGVVVCLGVAWVVSGWRGLRAADDERWARHMFRFSLLVLMAWSLALVADSFI